MRWYRRFLPYGVAIGSTAIALLLTLWLQPFLSRTIGAFFYIAIIVSAWYGGFRAGSVAIILSVLAIDYFFLPPVRQLSLTQPEDILQLGIFVLVALVINLLTSNLQESKNKIERLNQQLIQENAEQRVKERTAELKEVNDRLLVTLLEKDRAYQLVKEQTQLLYLAHDSIITWDLNSVITFWNQGAESMYGWTKAEAVGQETHNLLKTQFPKPLAKIEAQLFEKGYWEGELIHLTKFDRPLAVSSRWVVQKDDTGRLINILEINNDITDRKQAELILQQYSHEVEDLYNNAPCGYHSLDAEGTIIRINDTELKWLGYTRDEIIGKMKFVDLIKPEMKHIYYDNFPKFKQQGWLENLEFQMLNKDGSTRWVNLNATALKDEAGNFVMSRSSLFDITDRKQAEQMLELQAVITRNMAEGICLVRVDNGVIVYANPKFEQMFGYDSGELNGQHVSIVNYATESVSAEDVDRAIRSAVLQNGEFSYEVHNVKKDGTPFWCSATCSVFRHSDYGDVLVAVHQDITDRKQAQEALLQKSKQEQLLWNITQGIRQSLDLNTILNTAVTEVRQTLQADRAAIYRFNLDWSGDFVVESIGQDWVKLVGCDVQKVWEDTYLQETQGGRFRNNEIFVVNDIYKAGLQPCHIELLEQFQAKSYAIFPIFSGENLWGLLAIYQNSTSRNWQSWEIELLAQIASQLSLAIQQSEIYGQLQIELQERKQAEATIREAERRWRSLLDNVQLIVVGLDLTGTVNYINPFFLSLTGYITQEVIGKNWFDNFIPNSGQESVKPVFWEVLERNAYPDDRNLILTKSGEERLIAWNNTILQDANGNTIGTVSIGEDITERERVEQMKNEFIGIVSHELRTPLTSIRGSLGLLATGVMDDEPDEVKRMIEIASIDTERLVRLVNDILDLEKLETGKISLVREWCDAADLMLRSLAVMESSAQSAGVKLAIEPLSVQIWVAPDRIIQTFTNLLSNAIKFSPVGGTVTLSVQIKNQQVEDNKLQRGKFPSTLSCDPLYPHLLFSVKDEGRGIPSDKLESIFGRFQQVDNSDSRDKGGTGLGLAICKSIVQQHGGQIWVESIFAQGSKFFFTLPLQTNLHSSS